MMAVADMVLTTLKKYLEESYWSIVRVYDYGNAAQDNYDDNGSCGFSVSGRGCSRNDNDDRLIDYKKILKSHFLFEVHVDLN